MSTWNNKNHPKKIHSEFLLKKEDAAGAKDVDCVVVAKQSIWESIFVGHFFPERFGALSCTMTSSSVARHFHSQGLAWHQKMMGFQDRNLLFLLVPF